MLWRLRKPRSLSKASAQSFRGVGAAMLSNQAFHSSRECSLRRARKKYCARQAFALAVNVSRCVGRGDLARDRLQKAIEIRLRAGRIHRQLQQEVGAVRNDEMPSGGQGAPVAPEAMMADESAAMSDARIAAL